MFIVGRLTVTVHSKLHPRIPIPRWKKRSLLGGEASEVKPKTLLYVEKQHMGQQVVNERLSYHEGSCARGEHSMGETLVNNALRSMGSAYSCDGRAAGRGSKPPGW